MSADSELDRYARPNSMFQEGRGGIEAVAQFEWDVFARVDAAE